MPTTSAIVTPRITNHSSGRTLVRFATTEPLMARIPPHGLVIVTKYIQLFVDVFQVGAHGSLGDAEAAGDLGVGVPGRQQAQQVVLPGGEPGDRVAAPLGVQVGLVQVRTQQHQQRPVTLPGWQIALIAIGAALLAATAAVLADRARAARRKTITAAA
jgi:hypothetical protein